MTNHVLQDIDGKLALHGEVLLVFQSDGIIETLSTIEPDFQLLLEALNDVYQTSDLLQHDDCFTLNETIVAKCDGAHVIGIS